MSAKITFICIWICKKNFKTQLKCIFKSSDEQEKMQPHMYVFMYICVHTYMWSGAYI